MNDPLPFAPAHLDSAATSFSVTAVVPYFNSEATIERALDSIQAQTLPPLEVIVVDDGSRASSHAALVEIVAGHPLSSRIRLLRLPSNQGVSAARNHGWDNARGSWVAFLDADDSWLPTKLAAQVACLRRFPDIDLLGGRTAVGTPGRARVGAAATTADVTPVSLRMQLFRNRLGGGTTVMVRTSLLERFDEEMRYAEDYELWCRLLTKGARAAILDRELAVAYHPLFGFGGASGRLLQMHVSARAVLTRLHRQGVISSTAYVVYSLSSSVRFARRFVLAVSRELAIEAHRIVLSMGGRRTGTLARPRGDPLRPREKPR